MTDRSIAVCSWSLQPTDPADLVRDVTLAGVSRVQLALSPLIQDPDTWKGVADRLRDAGIEIISGMMAMEGEDYRTLESIARTGGLRPDATWPKQPWRARTPSASWSDTRRRRMESRPRATTRSGASMLAWRATTADRRRLWKSAGAKCAS